MASTDFHVAVVGGGVVGASVVRALIDRLGLGDVALLEQEPELGSHTSGRNGAVIHSGFPLPPGSPAARRCRESSARTAAFCRERGLPWRQTGILFVARDEGERRRLEGMRARAVGNGLDQVRLVSRGELRELEPAVDGVEGLLSPYEAVTDNAGFVRALGVDAGARGATIVPRCRVEGVEEDERGVRLATSSGEIRARYLINCAGNHADRVAAMCRVGTELRIIPFRADFYECVPARRDVVRRPVYPLPDPEFPFTGIHFVPGIDGRLKVGPTAAPAAGREAYRAGDVRLGEVVRLAASRPFRRMMSRPRTLKMAARELRYTLSRAAFAEAARRLVPTIGPDDLVHSHTAIRPLLVDQDGALIEGEVVRYGVRSCHVLKNSGAGFTTALAFADEVVDGVRERL